MAHQRARDVVRSGRSRAMLLAAFLRLAAPTAGAMKPETAIRAGLSPCIGDGLPPRVEIDGCGPDLGVEIVLRFASPGGTKEIDVGSCGNACDLRVIVDVAVCESMRTVSTNERTVTEIRGDVTVVDSLGRMYSFDKEQTIIVEIALLPSCIER